MAKYTDSDYAWLAGIIDGEGCIGIYDHDGKYKDKKYVWYRPDITIGMVDEWIIKRVKDMLGVGYVRVRKVNSRSTMPCYIFNTQKWEDAATIIRKVYKHLKLKKQQAYLLLLANKNKDDHKYLAGLSSLTRQLNQREFSYNKLLY